MRQLTEREKEFRGNAFNLFVEAKSTYRGTIGETRAFNAGFIAGLDYAQKKLDAYQAFIDGKITQEKLEEVINEQAL